MRILQSSVSRALCAIVVGVLLVGNPDSTLNWLTILIGVMFFLSGTMSVAAWLNARSRKTDVEVYDAQGNLIASRRALFPVVGLGSLLLGLILMLMPGLFVKSLMYVLGAIILLGAVSQFMTLASLSRTVRVPVLMWVCPSLVLIAGLVVLLKPMQTASLPLLITGWCLMVYGVMECINAVAVYRRDKAMRAAALEREAMSGTEETESGAEEV